MHKIDQVTEALSLARLRAVHLRPYFATALYRLIPVASESIGTVAVDKWWRLYYSPTFVERTEVLELATGLLHEVEHLLRDHHSRCRQSNLDPELFNIAGDLEINDDIDRREELRLIAGALTPRRFRLPEDLTAEEYYQLLPELGLPLSANCGSAAHGVQQPGELGPPDGEYRGISPEEAELVRRKVAEETLDWAKNHPGDVPGGLQLWADAILNPKVPWQRVLRGIIRSQVGKAIGMADYSFERPSRRQSLYPDVVLPALVEPTPSVAIVVDTSGSMMHLLQQALAEVRGVLRSSGAEQQVTVLSVDCAVHSVKQVFSPRSLQLLGGGGTDMGAGIAAAAALRPCPDFIVVLTDGFTPWPAEAPARTTSIVVLLDEQGVAPDWARTIIAA